MKSDTAREPKPQKGPGLTAGYSSSRLREEVIRNNRFLYRVAFSRVVLSLVFVCLCSATGYSQLTRSRSPNYEPQTPTSERSSSTSTGRAPMSSSPITNAQQVPGAARTSPAVSSLSLEQAISLALDNNLATLLAQERENEARGFRREALSGLLPNISGTAYQASLTENLAALGFTGAKFPGITSTFIGPFKNFDARARFQQTIFNLGILRNYQAGRAGVRVAEFQETIAREQVATATALNYLEALRADLAVNAAQANVTLAQTLLKLAQDQRAAGIATGVDVTRAETRLAQEQVRLSRAQTEDEDARLQLQRLIGLPLGSAFTLTDALRFSVEALPAVETAVRSAEDTRGEVRAAEAQVNVNQLEAKATRAEQLPSLEFVGDYGVSGITPVTSALPTRRYAIQLDVPIFNGYPAVASGMAVSPRGFGAVTSMLIVGRLINRIRGRYLVMFGFSLLAYSIYLFSTINLEISISSIIWPNIISGFAMGFIFVPLTTMALGTLSNEQMGNASGVFNLMRNTGGSVGIAVVTTMLARGAQAHQAMMVSHLTPYDPAFQQRVGQNGSARRFRAAGLRRDLRHARATSYRAVVY